MKKAKEKKNVWKSIAIIAIILIVGSVALKGLGQFLSKIPSVSEDYVSKVQAGGDIEAKYLKMGSHEVDYYEAAAMMSFQKFELYYPKDIASMDKLPVVVFVNGTGVKGSKYSALQKHLASWGFITIATEEEHAWNGFSAEMCIRYLETLNTYQEDGKENAFYGKMEKGNKEINPGGSDCLKTIEPVKEYKMIMMRKEYTNYVYDWCHCNWFYFGSFSGGSALDAAPSSFHWKHNFIFDKVTA